MSTTTCSILLRFAAVSSAAAATVAVGVGLLLRDVCGRWRGVACGAVRACRCRGMRLHSLSADGRNDGGSSPYARRTLPAAINVAVLLAVGAVGGAEAD